MSSSPAPPSLPSLSDDPASVAIAALDDGLNTERPVRRRVALAIEYDGSGFLGWQRLSHGQTVQAAVEAALSWVADASIQVHCSGRTDAGVHALNQIVHFDTEVERSLRGWMLGANTRLPRAVAVTWAGFVPDDFHARFSARRRRYRYRIMNRSARPALLTDHQTWEHAPLEAGAMHLAAQALVGEHDFSAFRAQSCQARTPNRHVHEIDVRRHGDEVVMEIEANAFLHHMVRNIAGSLLMIGRGERPIAWIAELLAQRRRDCAGPTAPPNGLLFLGPRYPRGFGLPPAYECDDPV